MKRAVWALECGMLNDMNILISLLVVQEHAADIRALVVCQ